MYPKDKVPGLITHTSNTYTVTDQTGTDHPLMVMTLIDPATDWFQISQTSKERSPVLELANYSTSHGWYAIHA